ncbi:Hpt domain-containing protein [Azohydromonas aeria]|uniref:Hpt domain-containing protein n=1 Tax=Azohydromonas aeria TaxID=2590212 RepID=UPI0012F933D8|nr:Hpt domain-containing protein [Azohydromonas aeria]
MSLTDLANAPASVQAGMARLRERFLAGLPQRWREIEAAADAAARAGALHQLAGVAGSFGLDALGNAARAGENAALAGDGERLALALQQLRECLQAAGVTVP